MRRLILTNLSRTPCHAALAPAQPGNPSHTIQIKHAIVEEKGFDLPRKTALGAMAALHRRCIRLVFARSPLAAGR